MKYLENNVEKSNIYPH